MEDHLELARAQRIRIMLWITAKDKLLTNRERRKRHMVEVETCETCGSDKEHMDHILRQCMFARERNRHESSELWHSLLALRAGHNRIIAINSFSTRKGGVQTCSLTPSFKRGIIPHQRKTVGTCQSLV
ncbi:uncharacterized protein LOC126665381 [Mercurialis annua]|uniref:uncharacterized protein LOC126665381 n=1 Tax=Mercurialis annua TaxID=3986 RepID=UPI00215F5626|nr:uncharacterized protein LOC126665381 [Mercurialis annua]